MTRPPVPLVPVAWLVLASAPAPANATGFTDIGQDIVPRTETAVDVDGALRLRGQVLYNLDLDRGFGPSGEPLFPVPVSDPAAQAIAFADMRLRTDLRVYPPFGGLAVKVRFDLLDDLVLGSTPEGVPAASTRQASPPAVLRLERAYGEALTPLGILAAGRMGSHWGLGIASNGGDCADCDRGDSADRIAFITPIAGLLWAAAWDFSATGPVARSRSGRAIDIEPADDVRTVTFAALRWRDDLARARRRHAGKATFEYGAYASFRWQDREIAAATLAVSHPTPIDRAQVVARGYHATAAGGWARLTLPGLRIEVEPAVVLARVDQPSLIPGVLMRGGVTSTQIGAALESEIGRPESAFGAGLDAGFASGDPAYGFGAFPRSGERPPLEGDLDGPQAMPPFDDRIDNFRFHPDYRVDRILFREIIGAVTDAIYVRPHVRWRAPRIGSGELVASLAAIGSLAVEARSTPGGRQPLGIELDPTLVYQSRDGFAIAAEYAVLFPLAGLDNPERDLAARPAQLARLRLGYVY
ncbi:MAG: TIGR04551 family protein [Deltaproteobacteria bacterium]|nr:TIGR04551 family protein [Deltaproteobacteria bacterium]